MLGTKRSPPARQLVRADDNGLEIDAQFMLIFLAKATLYARAQHRDMPPSLQAFVG
ncbi:MAG: hypothetical protein ABIR11_07350 [Candidatus Limnocylindrales bacterium]